MLGKNKLLQYLRFGLVGGTGTLLLFAETYALTEWVHLWYFWSFLISAVCNWTFLFFGHAFFTFEKRSRLTGAQYLAFLGIYSAALVASATVILILTSAFGWYYLVSMLMGTVVSTILTFTLSKIYIYGEEVHPAVETLKRRVKKHWAAIALALFMGASIVAPQIIFLNTPQYQGVMFMDHDAEEHYAARVAEVYRGNPNLGGVFLEPKNVPYLLPPLGEIITAWTGKIFFLDVDGALLLGKFLFPFLLSLFVYALAFSVSRARLTSLIAVVYVLLGGAYLSDFGLMRDLLFGHLHAGSFTFFSRPVNPQLSDLFLFAALYFLYQDFFVRERPRIWVMGIVGVLTGASLYMSPYTFSFMGGVLGGIFLWFSFARAWPKVVGAALAGAATVVALIPFIYNYALFHQAPQYPLLAQRLGFVSNHTPVFGIWLTVLLVAVVLWPHMYQKARVFFFGMVMVLWLVINQHVLTGIYMQPGHFHWYITKPLVGLVAALYVGWLLSRIHNVRLKTGVALLAVFSLLYTSPLFHVSFYAAGASAKTITTETYAPVIKTLQQLPVGGVWADSDMSLYIPIYTADTVPNNLYTIYYLNDEWKFEYVTFMRYRLMGTTPANVSEVFAKDRAAISDRLYSLYYPALMGNAAAIPDAVLADLAKKYAVFYKKSYTQVFTELSVRYVVAPKEAKARYDAISGLTLIQTPGEYLIYSVKNE